MALIPTSQKRPFIPAPGVAQIEMIYSYLGQTCENVYHFQTSGGAGTPTVAQLTAAAATAEAWEAGAQINQRSTQCTLKLIKARDISQQNGPVIERNPSSAVTGTRGAAPLPGNVTIAIKWGTGRGGRSFRGRSYHIGLTVDMIAGDQLAPAMFALFIPAYNALLSTEASQNGLTGVVVSYASNKFWRATAVMTPITTVSIDPDLDSQRRRLAGRGS